MEGALLLIGCVGLSMVVLSLVLRAFADPARIFPRWEETRASRVRFSTTVGIGEAVLLIAAPIALVVTDLMGEVALGQVMAFVHLLVLFLAIPIIAVVILIGEANRGRLVGLVVGSLVLGSVLLAVLVRYLRLF